jgi:hypothetical protein
MKIIFRIPNRLLNSIRTDLARRHPFAYERVGFVTCRAALTTDDLLILASAYETVPDDEYIKDDSVGAMMGPKAIHRALQLALNGGHEDMAVFHVHLHPGSGRPYFSRLDLKENTNFVPDFFHTAPKMPHGAIVLSKDGAAGRAWLTEDARPQSIEITAVGFPLIFNRS